MTYPAWGPPPVSVQLGDEQLGPFHGAALHRWVQTHPSSLSGEERLRAERALAHLQGRLRRRGARPRPFLTLLTVLLTFVGALCGFGAAHVTLTGLELAGLQSRGLGNALEGVIRTVVFPHAVVILSIAVLAATTPMWARIIGIIAGGLSLLWLFAYVPFLGMLHQFSDAVPTVFNLVSCLIFILVAILGVRR